MRLFGGRDDAPRGPRSERQRERERLERDARRAAREGNSGSAPAAAEQPPAAVSVPEPPPVVHEPPPVAHEPPPVAPEPEPPATQQPAVAPSAAPSEKPLGVRRVGASERMSAAGALGPSAIPPRPSRPRRRRRLRRLWLVLPLLLALAVAAFLFLLFQPFADAGRGRVVVSIPRGAGASEIGKLLARKGVVDSGFLFNLRARIAGKRGDLRSGRIPLRHDMSYAAALDALTTATAAARTVKLTIPEGRSRREIVPLVRQAGLLGSYLAATRVPPRGLGAPPRAGTLEGYLFPATYQLRPQARVQALVKRQLAAFKDAFGRVDLRYARRKQLTRYDVLIIASMIEREAQLPRDRPLVSAVIYNRLHQGMPLGIDATIRYSLQNWTRPLRVSELTRDSPYNTRTRLGLPPTPIGNPGLSSMQAAAHPARKPYLFYVVKPCGNGGHAFSSTEAQFAADVARYNAARSAQGGKNPKTCG